MKVSNFKWKPMKDEGRVVCYNGENNKFSGCIELVGFDSHGNQMWYVSLFDKETHKAIPVNKYGTPFTSVAAAKEAVTKAISR